MFCNNTVSFQWTSQNRTQYLRVYNTLWLASVGYGLLFLAVMPEIVESAFLRKSFQGLALFSIPFTQPFQQSPVSSACQWTPLRRRKVDPLLSRFAPLLTKCLPKYWAFWNYTGAFFSPEVTHQTTNQGINYFINSYQPPPSPASTRLLGSARTGLPTKSQTIPIFLLPPSIHWRWISFVVVRALDSAVAVCWQETHGVCSSELSVSTS